MIVNPYDRARLERKFPGAAIRELYINEDFEPGKLYFCGYWHQFFRVLDVKHDAPIWGTVYTVEWEDGTTNTHSTAPDFKFDFEIVPAAC